MTRIISSPKRRRQSSDSDLFMDNVNIDDLPEVLLVEILCRLPCNKLVFQCKCVSKRWLGLISAPYFVGRYLCIQRELQKASHLTTLVTFNGGSYSLLTTSDNPVFQSTSFTLSFLPCYQPKALGELAKFRPWKFLKKGCVVPPVIVRTYKDLVLCCATRYNQRDYYLCNPYTKQWTRLPPTPQVHYHEVPLAFVCDPYYKYEGDHCRKQEQIFNNSSVMLNDEYMWKVVRAVPNSSDPNFHLEVFSSETRQWRELVVSCSRPFSSLEISVESSHSIAYKGMLYWWCRDGFIFELDLSMSTTNTSSTGSGDHNNVAKCRFIELPEDLKVQGFPYLVLSQGRLLMYLYLTQDDDEDSMKVWELKQVVTDNSGQGKFKWLVDRVSVTSKDIELTREKYGRPSFGVVAFHQNNEDIVYLSNINQVITCNLRGGRLEAATKIRYLGILEFTYPFVLPWWPTPIPSRP